MTAKRRLTIVMPVFNDWESARMLVRDLAATLAAAPLRVSVIAVDDCSTQPIPADPLEAAGIESIECVRLAANVGHQRAIAVGLMVAADDPDLDIVAVMDSDGEDRPEELLRLVTEALEKPDTAFVAQRSERSEGPMFRIFYWVYIRLFGLLTGQRINFGNFTALQAAHVRRVINSQHVWNNFPAAIIQSRIPVRYLPTRRGVRYAGRSQMNFVGLVAHGLGAISVFSEAVFIRILVASSVLLLFSTAIGATAVVMKFATDLALPNWATTVMGFALMISIQALMMPILMAFMLLNNRATVQPLPKTVALGLIAGRTALDGRRP